MHLFCFKIHISVFGLKVPFLNFFIAIFNCKFLAVLGGSYVRISSFSLSRDTFCWQCMLMSSESFLFIGPLFLPVSFNFWMVALRRWNPEVNHAVLLFFYPFDFRMPMADFVAIILARNLIIFLWFTATCFSYFSFFLYLGLIPTRNLSQFLVLMPAVLFILFAGLSPRGMRVFFGSFLLINPWIFRDVHSITDIHCLTFYRKEIWLRICIRGWTLAAPELRCCNSTLKLSDTNFFKFSWVVHYRKICKNYG